MTHLNTGTCFILIVLTVFLIILTELNFLFLNIIISLTKMNDSDLIKNPKTNRFVKKSSQTGKRLLKELAVSSEPIPIAPPPLPPLPTPPPLAPWPSRAPWRPPRRGREQEAGRYKGAESSQPNPHFANPIIIIKKGQQACFLAACTVVVFSLLVGARRRSAVRCGAERSGATARPKDFEEQSELEALSVFNGM